MPTSRVAHALFFDDVRFEVGGKLSFMGMYSGELVVTSPPPPGVPFILPKFAVGVWVICDPDDHPEWLTIRVHGPPGRSELIRHEGKRDPNVPPYSPFEDPQRLLIFTVLPIMQLTLVSEGELSVTVETEKGETFAGRLMIRMPRGDSPNSAAE